MAKHAGGRPTLYRPEYCEDLVRFFDIDAIIYRDITITYKDGTTCEKTEAEAAPTPYFSQWQKKIGIGHNAFNEWINKYPEFQDAYKRAKQLQCEFLMETALKNVHNSTFTIFTMKNICGWRDEQHLKTEHNEEKTLNINLNGLTAEELRTIIDVSRNRALPSRAA